MSSMYGFSAQKRINNPAIILNKMFRAIPSPCLSANHQWTTLEGLVGLGTTYPAKASGSKYYAEDLSSGMYCIFDGIIYRDNNDLNRKSLVET
ncbi:MAG: asparagine synthase, partial [Candidatus Jettenia caeni]|nr:asparagine synthase [Candidatus Jettenia caeni]